MWAANSVTAARWHSSGTDGGADHRRRTAAGRKRKTDEPGQCDPRLRQTTTSTGIARELLAQHGHRTFEPGWVDGLLLGMPLTPRFLTPTCTAARELRQVSLGTGPPAERDLRGIEARCGVSRPARSHEPELHRLDLGRGLHAGAHLCDVPHVGQHAKSSLSHMIRANASRGRIVLRSASSWIRTKMVPS